jgi:hypothetical protein
MIKDIEKMTHSEWIEYRENKLDEYLNNGNKIKFDLNCKTCDFENDYLCLDCELNLLDSN